MVVVHHTITALQRFEEANLETTITTGAAGVDIFFVVSGFIIWVITAQRATDSLTFLKRRIVRIIPMYWLFTFITAAIYLTVLQDAYPDGISAEHVLKSLFFIPYYHPILDDQIFPLLIVGW